MRPKDQTNWMLSDAIEALARAGVQIEEALVQPFGAGGSEPSWEPPMDVIETEQEILILVALPGVDPDQVEAALDGGTLVISGRRTLPPELRNARILRLELPQGRFERRITLPTGRYTISRFAAHGCVGLRLGKSS
ncbi:MAG: Hsp20/alpha crystallin family protein [Bradyrhizobium sp.]